MVDNRLRAKGVATILYGQPNLFSVNSCSASARGKSPRSSFRAYRNRSRYYLLTNEASLSEMLESTVVVHAYNSDFSR